MAFNSEKCLKLKALTDGCVITLGASKVDGSSYYFSRNGSDWYTDQITLNNGEYAYVKGNSYPSKDASNFTKFDTSGQCEIVSGSIMSLVDDGAGEQTSIGQEYGFYRLFYNTRLTAIPAGLLPATELSEFCYSQMFFLCSFLTAIPAGLLPATELAENCYNSMFKNCNKLATIPANLLPATELVESCYDNMFFSSKLTEIPAGLLPATKLAKNCYNNMFSVCASLTTIPGNLLPATELAESCYKAMFKNCSLLTEIPSGLLPATELAEDCYSDMFSNCKSLTTVPEGAFMAKNLADQSCYRMFSSCNALEEIHVNFTEWPTDSNNALFQWVYDVAATGDFYCPTGLLEERGIHRIPTDWTIHKTNTNKVRGSFNFRNLKMPIG